MEKDFEALEIDEFGDDDMGPGELLEEDLFDEEREG